MTERRRLVRVPASSANLGPGYDVLAAALSMHLELEVTEASEFGVDAGGLQVPDDRSNLVVRAFERLHPADGLHFRIDSELPLAAGLGSSAAAIVAGLMAAEHMFELALGPEQLLAHAAEIEGHPDNVADALLGGLTVSCAAADGTVTAVSLPVPPRLTWVTLIPETSSSTAEARAVLPASVPRADAVFNVQRVALLLAAMQAGRHDALGPALDDRLHQPYRLPRLPGAEALIAGAYDHGAAGAALSGAGPSVIAICDSPVTAHSVEKAWNASGLAGMATRLRFDTGGARLAHAEEPA